MRRFAVGFLAWSLFLLVLGISSFALGDTTYEKAKISKINSDETRKEDEFTEGIMSHVLFLIV